MLNTNNTVNTVTNNTTKEKINFVILKCMIIKILLDITFQAKISKNGLYGRIIYFMLEPVLF